MTCGAPDAEEEKKSFKKVSFFDEPSFPQKYNRVGLASWLKKLRRLLFCVVSDMQSGTEKKLIPTSPFTVLEPQNLWIDEYYVAQKRRSMGFKAPKL